MFLKANGTFVCEDDTGEQVTLGSIRAADTFDIRSIVHGDMVARMHGRMAAGEKPWPLVCERCAFFRADAPLGPSMRTGTIDKIQVETTLACRLRCSGCNGFWQARHRPGPAKLELTEYEAVLQSCRDAKLELRWVEFCGQGEPLSHKAFPEFTRLTSTVSPRSRQRVITNGNFDFDERFPAEVPDELIVSCDGVYQHSYERYRENGDVATVLSFLKQAVDRARRQRTTVIWKYILFEHNDSDAELREAQRLACEFGVDRILFVLTHSSNKSKRFSPLSAETVPIEGDRTGVNYTPGLYRSDAAAPAPTPDDSDAALAPKTFIHAVIDELSGDDRSSFIRGWIVGNYGEPATTLDIIDGSDSRHPIELGKTRRDVANALPHWRNDALGFSGQVPVGREALRKAAILATVGGRKATMRIERLVGTTGGRKV